ncbi:unnamed protein product [Dovyalis caffra]|uniref:Uncharacterized protein n=1 Tax=Dovyalis caffra TaxID=77055 RepID=A0AAV1QTK2_9ROSI|nr:unnamed protein product [Dovyalis caffra]
MANKLWGRDGTITVVNDQGLFLSRFPDERTMKWVLEGEKNEPTLVYHGDIQSNHHFITSCNEEGDWIEKNEPTLVYHGDIQSNHHFR